LTIKYPDGQVSVLSRFRRASAGAPEAERRSISIADPALVEYLGLGRVSAAGKVVTETTALALTAVYRTVSLLAGTVASLPLKSYRTLPDGSRERIGSFLDDPGGPDGLTAYEWKETVMAHLLLHGNAYLVHVLNQAGGIAALVPVHPSAVAVRAEPEMPGGKVFTVSTAGGGQRDLGTGDLTHIMGLTTDGLCGISPIRAARDSLGTGLAGNEAAARIFANGLLIGGLVSGDSTLSEEQGEELKAKLRRRSPAPRTPGTSRS
jgi:HK97 family phage portal protein